ncbi:DUF3024 domain-containing protein [candidate division CSSED10-310 bacterium]|uniref:DUF3024 domain-containing protein n=1 Tax=candidate division CSSED10-310 bacterium TaxID=2855610 RepID=A0ABV6YTX7_UNCC1
MVRKVSAVIRQEITFQEKLSLAKKARRCNDDKFQLLCQHNEVTGEQLSLWVDSFEAGGEMGLRALDETIDPPNDEVERAISVVRLYLEYQFPRDKFSIKKRKNKINVSKIIRSAGPENTDNFKPIFQIRYFETKSKKALWLLYWHKPDGRWWPYITEKQRIYKIDQLMEEVMSDPNKCFWRS